MAKHFDQTDLDAMRQFCGPFRHKLGQVWPPLDTVTHADGIPLSAYEEAVAKYAERWALGMQMFFPGRHGAFPASWTSEEIILAARSNAGMDSLPEQVHHEAAALLITHWVYGKRLRELLYPEVTPTTELPQAS